MEHGTPTEKSERDRIRQRRGAQRKQQMRDIRKSVASWKSGRNADLVLAEIAATLNRRGDQ